MSDLISIIVPVYNTEDHLNRCIESLIGQTYTNIEIILVDDGSTDTSPNICDNYKINDNRVKVIHQNNKGASSARNIGIRIASGKYITFVDSDDFVENYHIDSLVRGINDFDADFVITRYSKNELIKKSNGESLSISRKDALMRMMLNEGFDCSVCCKLMPTSVAKTVMFDESLKIAEDLKFNYWVIKNSNRIVYRNIETYHYLLSAHGQVSSLSDEKISNLSLFEDLLKSETNTEIKESIASKYISTAFHLLSVGKENANNKQIQDLENIIVRYRNTALCSRHVTLKVRLACLASIISFRLVLKMV